MKLSKGLLTGVVTQVVALATALVAYYVVPEQLPIAAALIATFEGVAAALVVHFAAEDKIAAFAKANGLKR